jgi:hypothetical protein
MADTMMDAAMASLIAAFLAAGYVQNEYLQFVFIDDATGKEYTVMLKVSTGQKQ